MQSNSSPLLDQRSGQTMACSARHDNDNARLAYPAAATADDDDDGDAVDAAMLTPGNPIHALLLSPSVYTSSLGTAHVTSLAACTRCCPPVYWFASSARLPLALPTVSPPGILRVDRLRPRLETCSPDHRQGMAWTLQSVASHPLPRLLPAPFDPTPDTLFFAFSSKRLFRPKRPCNAAN
jgi:hypothetical protein